eukprot:2294145-Pyramimonas_sp.AAC.1
MREATTNRFEIACLVFSSTDHKFKQRIIMEGGGPFADASFHASRECRTIAGCRKYRIDELKGAIWDPIMDTLGTLYDKRKLTRVGLTTCFDEFVPGIDLDHPLVKWNDEMANTLGVFCNSLCFHRLKRRLPTLR